MAEDPFLHRLRALIGRDCRYYGRPCRVVEVLAAGGDDPGHLILEARDGLPPIQIDQYGQPAYRANEHIEVPLTGDDGGFSEELMHLLESLEAGRGGRAQ